MKNMFVKVTIGNYVICPHPVPDGRVWIEVMRVDSVDSHGHEHGVEICIDLDEQFKLQRDPFKVPHASDGGADLSD